MPRRTISIGRQPATFQFNDDHGPLVNGLAHLASQVLGAGKDKAMIEMERAQQQSESDQRGIVNGQRDRALDLQELALGLNQDKAKASAIKEPKALQPHVLDNFNKNINLAALAEGLVEPGLDRDGVPNGNYALPDGSPPEKIAAFERLRNGYMLDRGIDPATLLPTETGKWERPPFAAEEEAAQNAAADAERSAMNVEQLGSPAGELESLGVSVQDLLGGGPAMEQSQQQSQAEFEKLTAGLHPSDLKVLLRIMASGDPQRIDEAMRRLRAQAGRH